MDGVDGSPDRWEAVFWDIGGVILDLGSVSAVQRSFVASLVEELALDVDEETALETWRAAVGDYFKQREGTEFRSAELAYHCGVESVAGRPVERERWRPLFDRAFDEGIEPEPGALATLERLATREFHLGVVSDIDDREADRLLARFGLADTFDSVTTSEEVGRTKPDAAVFETALEKASATPDRTLMIGDRYTHDVEGAAAAGMWTVAYGADDGPAVDFRVENLPEVVDILNGKRDAEATDCDPGQ